MKTLTDTQYTHALIAEGEHQQQDFKFEISDARKIAKTLSAFSNTDGGRLLIGVKDNGKIAGVRSDEEQYMIEAAARLYCRPEVSYSTQTYQVEGRSVLLVQIDESDRKPVYAKDEAEFESLWQTMVNDAKGLGLDQITEYYTTEWNNALEKVKDYE